MDKDASSSSTFIPSTPPAPLFAAVTPPIIMKFMHNTPPDIDGIPRLRSYFSHPSDFWLVHHSLHNGLYYKSLQSFGCYTYYDFI